LEYEHWNLQDGREIATYGCFARSRANRIDDNARITWVAFNRPCPLYQSLQNVHLKQFRHLVLSLYTKEFGLVDLVQDCVVALRETIDLSGTTSNACHYLEVGRSFRYHGRFPKLWNNQNCQQRRR
jgi:hypothetical protein